MTSFDYAPRANLGTRIPLSRDEAIVRHELSLDERRVRFARVICSSAGLAAGSDIERALASTPREAFLGAPPWRFSMGKEPFEVSDPAELYQDGVVALDRDKGINNGQPSLHVSCLRALGIRSGETAVHVGAGAGYYTAILARLVGETGRVHAFEVEPQLAAMATRNLRPLPWAEVLARSGTEDPIPRTDVLYVSAGASQPLPVWLDALRLGGRLLFPLTGPDGSGAMLLVTNRGEGRFAARFGMNVAFIPCLGAQDPAAAATVSEALRRPGVVTVRSLRRGEPPDRSAWLTGEGWWLSTKE